MNERGVDPDYPVRRERESYERIIEQLIDNGGYKEGPESTLLKWILAVLVVLSASGILGGIVMYGDVQSLKSQVAYLTRIVEPHYRGAETP